MKMTTLAFSVLISVSAAVALPAQSAEDLQGIPLYQGFVRDDTRAKDLKDLVSRTSTEQNVKSVSGFDFESRSALVEDVIRWYAEKLGVSSLLTEEAIVRRDRDMVVMVGPGTSSDKLAEQGKPGSVSQVTLLLTQPQLQARESYDEDFAWKNEQYKRTHKPIAGRLSNGANFLWSKVEANGDVTACAISIADWSIDARQKVYQQRIKLRFTFVTRQSQKVAEAQKPKTAEQAPAQDAPVIITKAPTPGELGVPVYPGAAFADDGRSISMGRIGNYVWTSKDSIDQIMSFYEKATGKKRMPSDAKMGILIVEKAANGKQVSIMATTNGQPDGQTMLIIQNQ